MLYLKGSFCVCGEELKTDEEKAWGACSYCQYQCNGDFDSMPPRYEPHGVEE